MYKNNTLGRRMLVACAASVWAACAAFDESASAPLLPVPGGDAAVDAADGDALLAPDTPDGAAPDSPADAGRDGPSEGGGVLATPLCGSAECTDGSLCCLRAAGASCEKPVLCTGFSFQCVDATDCAPGESCCSTGTDARCGATCNPATERVLCRTNADCPLSAACSPLTCGDGGAPFFVRACAEGAAPFAAGGTSCTYP